MGKTQVKSIGLVWAINLSIAWSLSSYWQNILTKPILAIGILSIVMWIPGLLALFLSHKENINLPIFSKPNRFFFVAPLWILVLGFISFWISFPFIDLRFPFFPEMDMEKKVFIVSGFLVVAYILSLSTNMLFSLGEELYWRGYLWTKLKELGTFKALSIIGIAWGLWHFPLILFLRGMGSDVAIAGSVYPSSPILGCFMILAYTFVLNFLFTYARVVGRFIMFPSAMHGMIYFAVVFSWIFYANERSRLLGITGLFGLAILVVFCLCLQLFSTKTWKKIV